MTTKLLRRSGLLLALVGLALAGRSQPPPAPAPLDLAHLLPTIAAQPDSSRVDRLLAFADGLLAAGRFDEAGATLREATAAAQASQLPRRLSRVLQSKGYLAARMADFSQALRYYQQALDQARVTHDYRRQVRVLGNIAGLSHETHDWQLADQSEQQALRIAQDHHLGPLEAEIYGELSNLAGMQNHPDQALTYNNRALAMYQATHDTVSYYMTLLNQGIVYKNLHRYPASAENYRQVLAYAQRTRDSTLLGYASLNFPRTLLLLGQPAEAERYARQALAWATHARSLEMLHEANDVLAAIKEQQGQYAAALLYQRQATRLQDSVFNHQKNQQLLATNARYQTKAQQAQITQLAADNTQQQRQLAALLAGLVVIGALALGLGRRNRQRRRANALLRRQRNELTGALSELRTTQAQLIQREKLASLGELTAGIAHEIQNPLNFVNNFATLSGELLTELAEEQARPTRDPAVEAELLSDLQANLGRISQHGQRAAGIVRGMLEHSRASGGERQPTDLNALADEYLRLAYHGLRAKDKRFNATLQTELAASLPPVPVVRGDVGRVLLNLFTNALYAVRQRQQGGEAGYVPTVGVRTQLVAAGVQVQVYDNGVGMSPEVQAKVFQPFFTTKSAGEGTGLGLSLSHDIVVQGHGGTLAVASQPGQGATFTFLLPLPLPVA